MTCHKGWMFCPRFAVAFCDHFVANLSCEKMDLELDDVFVCCSENGQISRVYGYTVYLSRRGLVAWRHHFFGSTLVV